MLYVAFVKNMVLKVTEWLSSKILKQRFQKGYCVPIAQNPSPSQRAEDKEGFAVTNAGEPGGK